MHSVKIADRHGKGVNLGEFKKIFFVFHDLKGPKVL